MSDNRRAARIRKRLQVRFSETSLENGNTTHTGFTNDISIGGMYIVSTFLPPIGSIVHVQVMLDSQRCAYFDARVRRHKKVPVPMMRTEKGGFGIKFLTPAEIIRDVIGALPDSVATTPSQQQQQSQPHQPAHVSIVALSTSTAITPSPGRVQREEIENDSYLTSPRSVPVTTPPPGVPAKTTRPKFRVRIDSPEMLRGMYNAHVAYGGVFVRCDDPYNPRVELDTHVDLEVILAFIPNSARLSFGARVLQVIPHRTTRKEGGVSFSFLDVHHVRTEILRFLPT